MNGPANKHGSRRAGKHGRRLIYFSSVPYASYEQRPHFMVAAFANDGFDSVLWVDPYPTRLPALSDLRRTRAKNSSVTPIGDPRIIVVRPRALPVEPLPMGGFINHLFAWRKVRARLFQFASDAEHCVLAVGRPSRLAEWALKHVPHERSFADILDNFPAFYRGLSRASMRTRLRVLCGQVTDVYCSSTQLTSEMRKLGRDAVTVLNGYPTGHLPAPSEPRFRHYIGYVGSIAEWFDWPLVQALALALPEVTIRLVGPEFIPRPADLPSNIEFMGELPNSEMASVVSEFVVGLIPFRLTDLTSGVDPIKFYEYRSMGIPVWSTTFGEMQFRGRAESVTHISQQSNWRDLWTRARATQESAEDVASFRAEVNWHKRFEPVLSRSRIPAQACCSRAAAASAPLSNRAIGPNR